MTVVQLVSQGRFVVDLEIRRDNGELVIQQLDFEEFGRFMKHAIKMYDRLCIAKRNEGRHDSNVAE